MLQRASELRNFCMHPSRNTPRQREAHVLGTFCVLVSFFGFPLDGKA
jgi:hypothetical protein